MPPSAFRQDHFLNSRIQRFEIESAVRAELLQEAEKDDDLLKAMSQKNAVAASSEIEVCMNAALFQYAIHFGRHQRIEDFVGQLSPFLLVTQASPSNCHLASSKIPLQRKG